MLKPKCWLHSTQLINFIMYRVQLNRQPITQYQELCSQLLQDTTSRDLLKLSPYWKKNYKDQTVLLSTRIFQALRSLQWCNLLLLKLAPDRVTQPAHDAFRASVSTDVISCFENPCSAQTLKIFLEYDELALVEERTLMFW